MSHRYIHMNVTYIHSHECRTDIFTWLSHKYYHMTIAHKYYHMTIAHIFPHKYRTYTFTWMLHRYFNMNVANIIQHQYRINAITWILHDYFPIFSYMQSTVSIFVLFVRISEDYLFLWAIKWLKMVVINFLVFPLIIYDAVLEEGNLTIKMFKCCCILKTLYENLYFQSVVSNFSNLPPTLLLNCIYHSFDSL